MTNHGTASQLKVDGAYIEFQLAVLRALPRDIDPDIADGWRDNGESLARVLRQALFPPQPVSTPTILWTIEDDGRTNDELIASLEAKGIEVSDYAKQIIAKANELTPPKGTVYRLVGIQGGEFPTDAKRTTKHIFAEASRPERKYCKPPLRAALLLREKFSQEQLGYPYVALMSEPVSGSDGFPHVLGLDRGDAESWLSAWFAFPGSQWIRESLFVFLAPQVSQS